MENTRDILSGRTCLALFQVTQDETSKPSSKPSSASSKRVSRCLCLKKEAGPTPTYSWETDGAWHTELSMLNTGESPSVDVVSTLSQILQVGVPRTYYLSPRACQGILRRASVRGKELPTVLKIALERQATALTDTTEA